MSFSDLDGALLSGPDGDRTMNTNLLAEACCGQVGGDAGRYSKIFVKNVSERQRLSKARIFPVACNSCPRDS